MSRLRFHGLIGAAALMISGAAAAQLLPSLFLPSGGLGGTVGQVPVAGPILSDVLGREQRQAAIRPTLNSLGVSPQVASLDTASLLELRRLRLRELVAQYPRELEFDDRGQPVRRGVLIAIDADPRALRAAQAAGFRIVQQQGDTQLALVATTLATPMGMKAPTALKRLRAAAPTLVVDYDHVFEPAGGELMASAATLAAYAPANAAARTVVMIDGGVAAHPSLAGAFIEQQAFAGSAKATGHGTAVASLLVGEHGRFRGAARGARLYVGDIYGGDRSAGSATAIVKALGWAASKRPNVISVSLVGPQNLLLQRAVQALASRGIPMVAAVGNDGPSAPVQYPAAYSGVVAVTAVDARDRALPEAGRAARLDYAAPGADMAAALPGQGYARVRGTSFAVPLVAARIAMNGSVARLAAEAAPGRGKVGRGVVCRPCRVDPKLVGAK